MKQIIKVVLTWIIPFFKDYSRFVHSNILPNGYWGYLQFRLGLTKIYWPRDKTCLVANPHKVFVGINCKIGRPGTYIQGAGGVYIGNFVRFGPNVGILSSNHDLYDRDKYVDKRIVIGDYSWIGMNATVLAGVILGPNTIVGAGSVVTKSFPEGFCVIAGNPAKIIKKLDKNKVVYNATKVRYYGYIAEGDFNNLRSKYINDSVNL